VTGNLGPGWRQDREDGGANYRENTRLESGGDRPISGFDMSLNNFSRRILATAAATGHWQACLDFGQRGCALIDDLANLAIADGVTQTNVHGFESRPGIGRRYWSSS
jgi:hypothetical protein